MNLERWPEFWRAHGRSAAAADEQTQVLRTFNKRPIEEERWLSTLAYIDREFPVGAEDDLLDLCCGNGLFTAHFSPRCASAVAVDVSPELLAVLENRGLSNVRTRCADIRTLDFVEGAFSRVFLYAGIQYLSAAEAVSLLRKVSGWLRPGGLLFIGDIPDRSRLWAFYNTDERRALYFDNCVADRDVVGTWFEASWLAHLATAAGFAQAEMLQQPSDQIYAHFRFDFRARR